MYIIILYTIHSFSLHSQYNHHQFKYLTIADGLTSSKTLCALQDYKGYMWIGTFEGLNRYDGKNMVTYRLSQSDTLKYNSNYIMALLEDHNNDIIAATSIGLSKYDRDLDKLQTIDLTKIPGWGQKQITVNSIAEDSIGNLWLATAKGLNYYDRKNNIIKEYKVDPKDTSGLYSNIIQFVYIDKSERLWVGTYKGLNRRDNKTGKFERVSHCYTHNETISSSFQLKAVAEDKEGNLWFGANDGLYYYENKLQKENTHTLIHYRNNPLDPNSISEGNVKALLVDDIGQLWIGVENAGLNILQDDKKSFSHIKTEDFNPNCLNNESVHAITMDRNNNIWFCTYGGGINISVKNSDFIIHHKKMPGVEESLGSDIIRYFLEDKYNRKWIGTDGGGLNLYNEKTKKFVRYNTTNSNIGSDAILCMAEGTDNQIWLGTWAGGLVNFNSLTNTFKNYNTKNSQISDDIISSIAKDSSGNLWLGTFSHGLLFYNVKENKFINPDPSDNRMIFSIKIDSKGLLYCGVYDGLQIYNPVLKSTFIHKYNPNDKFSLTNGSIYDILIENDTSIWIATSNGLNHFNPINKKFRRYLVEDGLPDNALKGVTIDNDGLLWITTNNGLCRFDQKNNTFRNFTPSDGLQGNEFYERSILKTRNGSILVGGTNGFNIVIPHKIPFNYLAPKIAITEFKIFNQDVIIGGKKSPLSKQISETKEITLSHSQSVLTFSFAALDYTNPSKNQYAYKMDGFDKEWVYCGNKNDANYTNLNPGKYVFRVIGSNNDGIWNTTGTSISITITPPYWETAWFRTLVIGLIVSLLYIYIKTQIGQERKVAKYLEIKVKERTKELEDATALLELNKTEIIAQNEELDKHRNFLEELVELKTSELQKALYRAEEANRLKSSFLANMSHEIRTPMNAILGFCSLVRDENLTNPEREEMLDSISVSSHSLLDLINDILDLSKIQADQMTLNCKEMDIIKLLEDIHQMFSGESQLKDLPIILNTNNLPSKILINADLVRLRQVIVNMMSNATKFTDHGEIELGIRSDDKNLIIYVKDTGIGIPSHFGNSIFDRFTKIEDNKNILYSGTGLGLAISKSLVELWNGEMWYESVENKGSIFYFTFPYIDSNKSIERISSSVNKIEDLYYPNLQGKTILVAEDLDLSYKLLTVYLKKSKANILRAHNGEEAISLLNDNLVDLILMDIKMPIMNGMEASVEIRKKGITTPIIAQSAYAFEEEITAFMESGMNNYLTKPIVERELIRVLKEVFNK